MIGRPFAGLGRADLSFGLGLAVLTLAIASRGDAIVVGVLLVVASTRPVTLAAVLPALVASSWRWGSTSLAALAGNQAVLGPAGWVGPSRAATGSWLAAAALVVGLSSAEVRRRPAHVHRSRGVAPERVRILAGAAMAGVLAADLVVGPAPGGDLPARIGASILGTGAWAVCSRVRGLHRRVSVALDVVAVGAGVGALAAVAPDAPPWRGAVVGGPIWETMAVAGAVLGVVLVAQVAATARWSTRWSLETQRP